MATVVKNPIDSVPRLAWGESGECTFAGALAAATSVTDHPIDYVTIMGTTGLAFRTRWFNGPDPKWCPSSAVGEFPEETTAAHKASGWDLKYLPAPMDQHWQAIVDSIDKGLPIIAYGTSLNCGVIVGYKPETKTVLMRDYFKGDAYLERPVGDLEMFALFLGEHAETMSPAQILRQGIEIGVKNWTRRHDPEDETKGYWHGETALRKWASDLEAADNLNEKDLANLFSVSWWCFDSLCDARKAAFQFLEKMAQYAPAAAQPALKEAEVQYRKIFDSLLDPAMRSGAAFFGPWTGKTIADWTAEVRDLEQDVLTRCADQEAPAIASLRAALEAWPNE